MPASTSFSWQNGNTSFLTWDNGYPSGGNYWSDYRTRYPNVTEIDDSGIGDTEYVVGIAFAINSTHADTYVIQAVDRYPLIEPISTEEVIIETPFPDTSTSQSPESTIAPTPSQVFSSAPVSESPPTSLPSMSLQPARSLEPETEFPPEYIFALVAVILIITAVAAVSLALRRRVN